jgi:hypothetical protein
MSIKNSVTVNGSQAKAGSYVFREDVVELKEGAAIVMVNKEGRGIELKKPGTFKASVIDSLYKLRNGLRPDGWRYPHDFGLYYYEPVKKEPRTIKFREEKIQILWTKQNYIVPTNLTFFWCLTDTTNITEYKVSISTLFENKTKDFTTKDNKIEIPIHELGLNEEPFLISVKALNDAKELLSNTVIINWAEDRNESILEKFKSNSGDSAYWNKLGDACMEKALPYNALHAYYQAYKISKEQMYKQKIESLIMKYYENGESVLKCFAW